MAGESDSTPLPVACPRCGGPMERVRSLHQDLAIVPDDEGDRNSIHFHREVLVHVRPFNVLRIKTDLCRSCQVAILYYSPGELVFRG
jgi:hypothetical protein